MRFVGVLANFLTCQPPGATAILAILFLLSTTFTIRTILKTMTCTSTAGLVITLPEMIFHY